MRPRRKRRVVSEEYARGAHEGFLVGMAASAAIGFAYTVGGGSLPEAAAWLGITGLGLVELLWRSWSGARFKDEG